MSTNEALTMEPSGLQTSQSESPAAPLDIDSLIAQRDVLQKQVMTLKWDLAHNQLHIGKKSKLDLIEKELVTVLKTLEAAQG